MLALLRQVTRARQVYVELSPDPSLPPAWTAVHDCTGGEVEGFRVLLSRGIIAEAVASGRTVMTRSALADRRFQGRESVKMHQLQQVLCAPLGAGSAQGVVFLQGREDGEFTAEDQKLVERFARWVQPAIEHVIAVSRRADPDPTAQLRRTIDAEDLVGTSPAVAQLLRDVSVVARVDVTLLLIGESGTGKSHVARVVHRNSARRAGPLVEVNAAALPDTLFEGELFGAERGAYTGADRARAGKFEAASGGTLFLDEIGDLSAQAQAKLLQVLETGTYYRLGSTRPLHADVRLVCATNRDLEAAVAAGSFRSDLFYRIAGFPVRVPSLAERREDVPLLARSFVVQISRSLRVPVLDLSPAAEALLCTREWPGNVRELYHVVQRAMLLAGAEAAARLGVQHFSPAAVPGSHPSFHDQTRDFQRALLKRTLDDTDYDVPATAERLDLARSYVYKLMTAHGLAPRRI
jgi:Nif-specific regulatory protein